MRPARRPARVTVWTVRGPRATLDAALDAHVRRVSGRGRCARRCCSCGATDHGTRVFLPDEGNPPVPVTVAHAGSVHVAAIGWGRLRLGIDLAAANTPSTDDDGWLRVALPDRTVALLTGTAEQERTTAALALWAAREALGKRDGTGLLDGPAAVPLLATAPAGTGAVAAVRPAGSDGWWVRWPVPGHVCVLAGTRRYIAVAPT